jgi:hypothetical protein
VTWPPVHEDVSPEAEERPPLEGVTKQSSENRHCEQKSVCDNVV